MLILIQLKSLKLRLRRLITVFIGVFVLISLFTGQAIAQSSIRGIAQKNSQGFPPFLQLSNTRNISQNAQEGVDRDCQCRAPDGQMKNLGTVQCVNIVGNKKLVRCEMSTNTPYWKDVEGAEGCPAA